MRVELKTLLDNLGVTGMLAAYETAPWSVYDEEKEATCNAEVRMNQDADEIEAELQIINDVPSETKPPIEQVFWMFAKPAHEGKWDIFRMKIKGEEFSNTTHAWDEKGCGFFKACVQELKLGNFPDIDEILEKELNDKERYGGNRRGGGGKAPKIKPQQLLGLKSGRGI